MLISLLVTGVRPGSKTLSKQSVKLYKLWSHIRSPLLFRKIAALPVFAEIGATEPLKYVDTRYGNRVQVIMGRCLLDTRSIYGNLMVDTEMEA